MNKSRSTSRSRSRTGWLFAILVSLTTHAGIDLVMLPNRDTVQLTIYNSADLTLARDRRSLTMREGTNRLQFSWENTLIDPTSLDMMAPQHASQLDIQSIVFPPRVKNVGIWNIDSEISGEVPMEISYFTSGISWRAFYMGTLSEDESTMRLQGYVRVANRSGEDYENAQVRLVVGKVNLLDQIAALAQRQQPYGTPVQQPPVPRPSEAPAMEVSRSFAMAKDELRRAPKKIVKEGLSEYFLYTIEGEETVPNQWDKRLPSFEAGEVPVVNLYKYDEQRYGGRTVRFLSFKNDTEHKLGETPIPGGILKVYRSVDEAAHLSYEGQSSFQYIPVEEDVELDLGANASVIVQPTLMDQKTDAFMFDGNGNIDGWDETQTWQFEVKNTRDLPVTVELTRHFPSQYWDIVNRGDHGDYEKIDLDTVRYTLELAPRTTTTFSYEVTIHQGRRADR